MSTEFELLKSLGNSPVPYAGFDRDDLSGNAKSELRDLYHPHGYQKRTRHYEEPRIYAPRPKWIRKAVLPEVCQFTMFEIMGAVALVSGLSVADLRSNRRFQPLCDARYVFMHLARLYTTQSARGIGRYCRRDRSTVEHGLARVRSSYAFFEGMIEDAKSALAERLEAKN